MNLLAIWAIRELCVAILAVNTPAIKPLFSSSQWIKSSGDNTTLAEISTRHHVALRSFAKDADGDSASHHGSTDGIVLEVNKSSSHNLARQKELKIHTTK